MRRDDRCYLSGKITGNDGYLEQFEEWEDWVSRKTGMTVVNPARVNHEMPKGTSYSEYMEMCECMMRLCGSIFMIPGWEESQGARYEMEVAKVHGMKILSVTVNGSLIKRKKAKNKGRDDLWIWDLEEEFRES